MADLAKTYEKLADKAYQENLARMQDITSIHDEIIRRYSPGGEFLQRGGKLLEEQKGRETGKAMQQLISSGLYGTTGAAGLGRRWEAEVGAPSRFKLEDVAMERLSSAQLGKASFMEGIQQPYPDFSALFQASQAQGATGGTTGGGGLGGSLGGRFPSRFGGGDVISGGGDVGNVWDKYGPGTGYGGPTSATSGGTSGGSTATTPTPSPDTSGGKSAPVSLSEEQLQSSELMNAHKMYEYWTNYVSQLGSGGANPMRISIEGARGKAEYWARQLAQYSS